MKILSVLHGFPPETNGGTERTVEALASAMQAAGHEVAIAAGSLEVGPPARVGKESLAGLDVRRMHRDDLYFESWFKAHSPGVSSAFEQLLAELKPDVVHVHHWMRLSSDLVRLAHAAGCATAVTMHDYYTALASPVRRAGQDEPEPPASPPYVGEAEIAESFAFHRRDFLAEVSAADLRFAPSQSHAEGVQAMAAGPLGPIEVNQPPLLQRPPRRPTPAGPRGKRLVVWGGFYEDKGLGDVLEALRRVDGWSLDVWGDVHEDAYRKQLDQLARGLDVRFRGASFTREDLAATDADYAVLPSKCYESYGLTLDEALCIGLPVLVSDLPVFLERAPAGSSAFFTAGDVDSLTALLADESRLLALETPAEPQPVSADAVAGQLLDRYEAALRGEVDRVPESDAADGCIDGDRAAMLFRRAERRLWTALQQPDPPAPPDGFLPS